jgi:hypothetical protein
VPDFVESTVLVAVTTICVCVVTAGGLKTPEVEIAPAVVDHVTVCKGEFVPAMTAEQVEVEAAVIVEGAQVVVTLVTVGELAVTAIADEADFEVSVVEVAVNVTAGGLGIALGAV